LQLQKFSGRYGVFTDFTGQMSGFINVIYLDINNISVFLSEIRELLFFFMVARKRKEAKENGHILSPMPDNHHPG